MASMRHDPALSPNRAHLTPTVLYILFLGTAGLLAGCGEKARGSAEVTPHGAGALRGRLTDPAALQDDDGQWVMPAKNYASTRYSSLAEITAGNVKTLKLAWTFSTGTLNGHEAAPLVVGSTVYVVTPYPHILYALDLTQPGAPAKWAYKPDPDPAAQGVACCDVVNRGAAYADGKIF